VIKGSRIPRATYRLQFNYSFRFKDAQRIVPYLADLGVSELYASPFLKAGTHSLHGYDVSDHNQINPEIGSEDEYTNLVEALAGHDMGVLLDVVPNHMGIGSNENAWWNDLLENGPIAVHAPYFDVDWTPLQTDLRGKVLLPVLGDQYGRVLERGELKLTFHEGSFALAYYEHIFPLAPTSYAAILAGPCERLSNLRSAEDAGLVEIQSILTAISYLPSQDVVDEEQIAERNREKEVVKRRLAALVASDPDIGTEIEAEVTALNGTVGDTRSFDALDSILNDQAYRLAYWRVASEEINYRRFFDVNTLAAVRMERPEVFAAAHQLIFRLLREGKAHGLRIDHPDGLLDPAQYFQRLQDVFRVQSSTFEQEAANPASGHVKRHTSNSSLYVVVEKILAKDEPLPDQWAVDGTTGYDFMTAVGGIFVDGGQRRRFDDLYARFIGHRLDFHNLVYDSKRRIMNLSLASEINVLAWQLNNLSERDRRFRDFTLYALRDALREVIACFPVYRTYIAGRPVSEHDRSQIEIAVAWALRRNQAAERSVFSFLRQVLLLEALDPADEDGQHLQLSFVQKFQQTTGPVAAKAVEDTSFYIYNRLVALNEVGGEPEAFGVSVPGFHRLNAERLERWPNTLLSTSTHDTKRSEDVRARIAVLSEIPRDWSGALTHWTRRNRRWKVLVDGVRAPSRNDEYLLYQILLGAWPLEAMDDDARAVFVGRIQEYMAKATKEAKVHTSWINPNEPYDEAIQTFVAAVLDPARNGLFLEDFCRLERVTARAGAVNSLAQTLLKLTAPGVPDIYQGNELWDLSLVDPDNRRPVDYRLRQRLLRALQRTVERAGEGAEADATDEAHLQRLARSLAKEWPDGRVKMYVTWRTLDLRHRWDRLFREGAYLALASAGTRQEQVCAFVREYDDHQAIVVVPRLGTRLLAEPEGADLAGALRFQHGAWDDTVILLPDTPGRRYKNVFTGEIIATVPAKAGSTSSARSALPIRELFADFPVTLLIRELP
jgi:(1->4)-alpha-D-glucan 1-alpha-D-glucosylmutase